MKGNVSSFRIPSFARVNVVNNHLFEVNDTVYEYVNGQYFRKASILKDGSSFGEIAL